MNVKQTGAQRIENRFQRREARILAEKGDHSHALASEAKITLFDK